MILEELQILLQDKKSKNHSYSLRALARDLKINQAHLCRVMNKKLNPTPLIAYKLGTYQNFSSDKILKMIESTLNIQTNEKMN
jgi:hypothetical protein